MAIYEHICTSEECRHEWVSEYSIKADPPKLCPKCNQETAKRLISLGGKGVVDLIGQDLVDKVKADTQQLKRDMHNDEKLYSNMLGENRYQQMQKKIDEQKKIFRRK